MSDSHSIEDERIAFYYRHREDIRRWASIESDLPQHVHRYLLSLQPRVRQMANEYQAHPYMKDLDLGYPKLLLARSSWLKSFEYARVGIGVEWRSNHVNLVNENPYVGVWTDKKLDGGEKLQSALVEALNHVRSDFGYKSGAWWPVWEHVAPDKGDAFWEDLRPLTQKLMDRIQRIWQECADIVDEVVAQHPR